MIQEIIQSNEEEEDWHRDLIYSLNKIQNDEKEKYKEVFIFKISKYLQLDQGQLIVGVPGIEFGKNSTNTCKVFLNSKIK